MNNFIIFGYGGHARVILDSISVIKNSRVLGFISNKKYDTSFAKKVKYLGEIKNLNEIIKKIKLKNVVGIIAIGNNIKRKQIFLQVNKINRKFKWGNVIHPAAVISPSAIIGSGNMILAGSIICAETEMENHVSINTGSYIDHNNKFCNFSSTGPGVATGGNVVVGEQSFLGIGATIKQNIIIEKNTIVGGQAFVNKNCKPNSIYFGIPARRIKKRILEKSYL